MSTMRVGSLKDTIQVIRLPNNPIVHPQKIGLEGAIGENINGSSLIKVPDWIKNPLGRYYLYFAHHRGQFIRLAYADRIDGLWQIYKPGTLQIEQTNCFDHIASPDVHIDEEKQEIQMYFHGCSRERQQVTMLAISKDGLQFTPSSQVLGPFYFRVFQYGGYHYALAKNYNIGGILLRSPNGSSNFEVGLQVIPNLRHTAVLVQGHKLIIFYSKIGDAPECILMSWIDLTKDWQEWRPSQPIVILEPEMDYEGAHLPIQPSVPGLAKLSVRQLRDPAIYEENRQIYLLYSVAGEQGIAIAKLNFNSDIDEIANMTPKEQLVQNTSSLWQNIRANVQLRHRACAIQPVSRDRPIPLSFAQERLWQLHQLNPKNTAHHLPTIIRLQGKLNLTALEQSFREIARRHEILRTTFPPVEGQPVQVIASDTDFQLKTIDLQHLSDTEQKIAVERSISSMRNEPFDLAIGPLWRVQLLHLREDDYLLIRVTHHIIFDGWSGTVFRQELTRLYAAFSTGQSASLPPLNIQYADYAAWQRQTLNDEAMSSLHQYWQQQLSAPIAPLELPLDRPRPPLPTHEGSQQTLTLSPELTRSLKQLSHQEGVSLFITLLAAFKALLFGYTQQTDILICSPVANRPRPELKKSIGYFNNVLLLRTDLSGNPSARDLLHRVSQVVLGAQEHQDLPLAAIAEFPHLAPIPFNRAMFALQNMPTHPLELTGITVRGLHGEQNSADFDLFLSMREREGQLVGQLKYRTALFETTTIAQMLENFQVVLESWVAHPEQSIAALPVQFKKPIELGVNIRGFRIELGEIEAVLSQHPQVEEAIVIDREDRSGDKYLAAYIVPKQTSVPSPDDLRQFLRNKLPDYMIPAAFVPLEALPLNPNGKIDRQSLPAPDWQQQTPASFVAPRNPIEQQLAEIWAKVLWREQPISIHDNFFDLGGHSLLAVRLVAEIENSFKTKLPLAALFQLNTVEELAKLLAESQPETEKLEQATHSSEEGEKAEETRGFLPLDPEIHHQLLALTAGWKGQRVTPDSLIFGLNTQGTLSPLFWCFQGYREFSQLAKYLGAEQPVYGMRSGHLVMSYSPENIQALAAHYVREILRVQPEGSYRLGGNCQSARIMFEIAQQLQQQGKTVAILCLLEAFIPKLYFGKVALFFGRESDRFNPYKAFAEPELGYRKFYRGSFSINIVSGDHGQYFNEPNIQMLAEKLRETLDRVQTDESSILSQEAYRSQILTIPFLTVQTGETRLFAVTVRNISSVTWLATEKSGIFLANHWLDEKGEIVRWLDLRVPLDRDLPPNASIDLEITVNTPKETGQYGLELDLVEEGVTWFKQKGSDTVTVPVTVIANRSKNSIEFLSRSSELEPEKRPQIQLSQPELLEWGPCIMGGTGGSGTRVVARIVRAGGVFIGSRLSGSEDALDAIGGRSSWLKILLSHWQSPIPSSQYSEAVLALQIALENHLAEFDRSQKIPRWGWKFPPSILFLPFLHEQFPKVKCLHLVRDGRDMAFSKNQIQLGYLGSVVLTSEEKTWSQPLQSIAMWSRLNLITAAYGEQKMPDQYLRVRFEDLCAQPVETTAKIFEFLNLEGDVENIASNIVAPPSSLGRWRNQDSEVIALLDQIGQDALQKFGYREETSNLSRAKMRDASPIVETQSYRQLGDDRFEKGDFIGAIDFYQKAIKFEDNSLSRLYLNLGTALGETGKVSEAIACYEKLLQTQPNLAEIYYNLGKWQCQQGEIERAICSYNKAIELQPDRVWLYPILGDILAEHGQLEMAITRYQTAIEFDESRPELHFKLGNLLEQKGDIVGASNHYQNAIKFNLEGVAAYIWLGNVLVAQEKVEEAIVTYQQAISRHPSNAHAYQMLGNAQKKKGDLEAAISSYQSAIKYHKNPQFGVYKALGDSWSKVGQKEEAIAAYQKARELQPENPGIYRILGNILYEVGDRKGAISSYQKAIALNPQQPFIIYKKLGDLLCQQNQTKAAIIAYQEALKLQPQNQAIHQKLENLINNQKSILN